MGLKISTYKTNGNEFVDVYAKVDNVHYDNNSKIASFDIAVYPTKGSDNLIEKASNNWVKIEAGTDMIAQCYTKLNQSIVQLQNQITRIESEIATTENLSEKTRKEFELRRLKMNKSLQLVGVEWQ